jgi:nucleoid-associated protein YgaU
VGAQPLLFAQNNRAASSGKSTITIDLESSSDEDIARALKSASNIEFISKNEINTVQEEPLVAQTPEPSAEAEPVPAGEEIPIVAETEPMLVEEEGAIAEETVTEEVEYVVVTEGDDSPKVEYVIVEETVTEEVEYVVIAEGDDTLEGVIVEETITEEAEYVVIAEETPTAEADPVLAQEETPAAEQEPSDISNNEYFQESQRLLRLAQETYEYGNYDASANFAREAIYYALLFDVHVAIALAKDRIDWAVSSGASKQYPYEFDEAETWYGVSLNARDAEEWENALDAANKVKELLAYIAGGPGSEGGIPPLPARYTVRSWLTVRDCFWNIAARSWVYGDPRQWRVLYNANKSKLPDPNNPNLVEPGTVLDIPSIKGEVRQGEWSSDTTYGSIP